MADQSPAQRILLPLDGSEMSTIAIPYVHALATPGTEVVVFRVVPDPVPMMELAGSAAYPIGRVRDRQLGAAQSYVDAVADVLRDLMPRVTTATTVGEPADEILRVSDELGADLIVVASHGRGFLGRVVAGSVADRIARASSVPVMLVHHAGEAEPVHVDDTVHIKRLVVPLDGSARAASALPVAVRFASHLHVPIHLVRAVLPPDTIDHRTPEEYADTFAAEEAWLAAEAHRLEGDGVMCSWDVVVGPAAPGILGIIQASDVVVMSSHGVGGVRRWLLGSVAEKLIHAGMAPVVLVPVPEREALAAGLT
jgi:nucleotide-binding universal stress UspA family protein